MKFILYLVFVFGGYTSGEHEHHVVITGEYNNLKACQDAGLIIQKQIGQGAIVKACTAKGKAE